MAKALLYSEGGLDPKIEVRYEEENRSSVGIDNRPNVPSIRGVITADEPIDTAKPDWVLKIEGDEYEYEYRIIIDPLEDGEGFRYRIYGQVLD